MWFVTDRSAFNSSSLFRSSSSSCSVTFSFFSSWNSVLHNQKPRFPSPLAYWDEDGVTSTTSSFGSFIASSNSCCFSSRSNPYKHKTQPICLFSSLISSSEHFEAILFFSHVREEQSNANVFPVPVGDSKRAFSFSSRDLMIWDR